LVDGSQVYFPGPGHELKNFFLSLDVLEKSVKMKINNIFPSRLSQILDFEQIVGQMVGTNG
jgi:hypothetical protein